MVYGVVLVLVITGRGWAILSLTKLHNMFSVQILIRPWRSLRWCWLSSSGVLVQFLSGYLWCLNLLRNLKQLITYKGYISSSGLVSLLWGVLLVVLWWGMVKTRCKTCTVVFVLFLLLFTGWGCAPSPFQNCVIGLSVRKVPFHFVEQILFPWLCCPSCFLKFWFCWLCLTCGVVACKRMVVINLISIGKITCGLHLLLWQSGEIVLCWAGLVITLSLSLAEVRASSAFKTCSVCWYIDRSACGDSCSRFWVYVSPVLVYWCVFWSAEKSRW